MDKNSIVGSVIKSISLILGLIFTLFCIACYKDSASNSALELFLKSYGLLVAIIVDATVFIPLWLLGHIVDLLEQIATNTRNTEENTSSTYISDEGAIKDIRSNLNEIKTILENQQKKG